MKTVYLAAGALAAGLIASPAFAQTAAPTDGAVIVAPEGTVAPDATVVPEGTVVVPESGNPDDIIVVDPSVSAEGSVTAPPAVEPGTTPSGSSAEGTPDGGAIDTTGMSEDAAAAGSEDTPSGGIVPGQESN